MSSSNAPGPPPFGVANYLSFDDQGFLLKKLGKINVFIGKNNCGKSNVLRAIDVLRQLADQPDRLKLDPTLHSYRRSGAPPSATVGLVVAELVKEPHLARKLAAEPDGYVYVRWNSKTNKLEGKHPFAGLPVEILDQLMRELTGSWFSRLADEKRYLAETEESLVQRARSALQCFKNLIYIPSFREIRKDGSVGEDVASGRNVIPRLRQMQVAALGREHDEEMFARIQEFVRSLLGQPKLSIRVPQDEVILVEMHGNRLPLQSFGTGVHQLVILCIAIAIHDGYVVCIEEPEIHMHPELQRHFIRFLRQTNSTYFIATHSNVFMDFVDEASIYRVTYDGEKSTATRVQTSPDAREVLADLGCKASDLLQANCILWVEGPSDRIYLNKWLSLLAPEFVEGIHYAVTFYGGKVLFHFTATDDPLEDLVEVLRINSNAIFVMDRDTSGPDGKLSPAKERLRAEVGEEKCWVTRGREIENYLRTQLIDEYLSEKTGKPPAMTCGPDDSVHDRITDAFRAAAASPPTKVELARALSARMTDQDLEVLDLRESIVRVIGLIRQWNHVTTPETGEASLAT